MAYYIKRFTEVNEANIQWSPGMLFSLVPRPFPPPVFDRLQYCKRSNTGGGNGRTVSDQILEVGTAWDCKRSNTGGGNGLGTRLDAFVIELEV